MSAPFYIAASAASDRRVIGRCNATYRLMRAEDWGDDKMQGRVKTRESMRRGRSENPVTHLMKSDFDLRLAIVLLM